LRLYPQLAVNVRFATRTTVLPSGGGPDGQSPVLIPKGTGVGWSTYHLHRLESIYGPDARVYNPQRWESGELIKTVGLGGFVDFNGGPRVCLGSMLFPLHAHSLWFELNCGRKLRPHGDKLCNHTDIAGFPEPSAPARGSERGSRRGAAESLHHSISWRRGKGFAEVSNWRMAGLSSCLVLAEDGAKMRCRTSNRIITTAGSLLPRISHRRDLRVLCKDKSTRQPDLHFAL
jgi:Cytochrome P450